MTPISGKTINKEINEFNILKNILIIMTAKNKQP
jgi:hypothetical protein